MTTAMTAILIRCSGKWIGGAIGVAVLSIVAPPTAQADVVVYDTAALVEKRVVIRVKTAGRVFALGGQRVTLLENERVLGRLMTGGDGYGFHRTVFHAPGLYRITARSRDDSADGLVLITASGEPVIVVELAGASFDRLFDDTPRGDAHSVLHALAGDYRIIYLAGVLGIGSVRRTIEANDYPESVVLRFRGKSTLRKLVQDGLTLHALIGNAEMVDSAGDFVDHRYSFDRTPNGKRVQRWEDLLPELEVPQD